jgi:cell wall-associated NlpC family hydrolase
MARIPGGVLARVIICARIAAAVFVGFTAPAGAAGRPADQLSESASQSLADLRTLQFQRVAVAAGGGSAADEAAAAALYQSDLTVLAALVAPRTGSTPGAFVEAWTAVGETRMGVLLSALSEVGVPYVSNTSRPGVSFDCSGLTKYAWEQAGVALVHSAVDQIRVTAPRTWETAQAGDLVWYPGHVMIYAGAGQAIIDAPHTGAWVRVKEYSGRQGVRIGSPLG